MSIQDSVEVTQVKKTKSKRKRSVDAVTPNSAKKSKVAVESVVVQDSGTSQVELNKSKPRKKKKRKKGALNGESSASLGDNQSGPNETSQPNESSPKKKKRKKPKKSTSAKGEAATPDQQQDGSDSAAEATPAATPVKADPPASKKGQPLIKPKDPEQERRTVFVGNLPLAVAREAVRKLFLQYGAVESVRFRSAPRLDAAKPIRMSVITQRFNKDRSSLNGYVRFADEASARAAQAANGVLFQEHHLRVNIAGGDAERPDPRFAVFVGGLPLNVEDDQLWRRFIECGDIASVRVVRDHRSSVGKGFGYVNFTDETAVGRALKLNGSDLDGRSIRVQKCHATAHAKVDRVTGKKLRKERVDGETPAVRKTEKLAPVNVFSGEAVAESKSSLKKQKGKKKERWDDAKRQKRNMVQSLSKTIVPASAVVKTVSIPPIAVGGVTPQNKKIKFDFTDDAGGSSEKKKDAEKLKELRLKKEAKKKKKAKGSQAKKKRSIVEPLTNILPS